MKLYFLLIYMLITSASYGQFFFKKKKSKTNAIDINVRVNKERERPMKKYYGTIVKNNTKHILYGNKCFEEFTKKLGFIYVVQNKKSFEAFTGIGRFFHNMGTKITLVFTAWPWWKLRVNKKKKECRKLSGDFAS